MDSYEIFPDSDTWANAYDLFRFSERPGERPVEVDDPRLDCAILRPMMSDGEHFLSYYLTETDEAALAFKEYRMADATSGSDDDPLSFLNDDDGDGEKDTKTTAFKFVRDYETVKVEQEVPNEFLLVLNEGGAKVDGQGGVSETRRKGAYYKNIERKMFLKKKRTNVRIFYLCWSILTYLCTQTHEKYLDKWELVHLNLSPMDAVEAEERAEALAEVVDPAYLMGRDADAEGEVEVEGQDVPELPVNGVEPDVETGGVSELADVMEV